MITIIGVTLVVLGVFLLLSFKNIQNEPPHVGAILLLDKYFIGKWNSVLVTTGWAIAPPFLTRLYTIDASVKTFSFSHEVEMTDHTKVRIPISISFKFAGTRDAVHPYMELEKEAGVKRLFEDAIHARLRAWVGSIDEGPANFDELRSSDIETISVLVKASIGNELPKVKSGIPTSALLKYFDSPQKPPSQAESRLYGENWEDMETALKNDPERKQDMTIEEHRRLVMSQIENRRVQLQSLKGGGGSYYISSMGIKLVQFTIGDIDPLGELAEFYSAEVKERLQRDAEKVEIDSIRDRLRDLTGEDEPRMSVEEAVLLLQTERGKATRAVDEKRISITPESGKLIELALKGLGGLVR